MPNCVNDFSPLILAVAGVISVQMPILITMLVNQQKIKRDVIISKGLNYNNEREMTHQTNMINAGLNPETSVKPPSDKGLVSSGR
jgi:hypothetical protein